MTIILKRYDISKKIGQGNFGHVYKGIDLISKKGVAVKVERSSNHHFQLEKEYKIYRHIGQLASWVKVYNYEHDRQKGKAVLVMELLGLNLEQVFQRMNRKMEPSTIGYIAQRMLESLQTFHRIGYIHRDIKPQNFVIKHDSIEKLNKDYLPSIQLIDYGIAKPCKDLDFDINKKLKGTVSYVSPCCHLGMESSKRDDLVSLGYILIYLIRGSLPWQSLDKNSFATKEIFHEKVMSMKLGTRIEDLVNTNNHMLKVIIIEFFLTVYSLGFNEQPPYEHLKELFDPLVKEFNGFIQ